MRVAVTGATGYVGHFVVADLLAHGHEVVAWAKPETAPWLPEAVQRVSGRLGDESSCSTLLKDCDGLVHAAFAHAPGRYRGGEGEDPTAFLETNLQGSLQLLLLAREMGVERGVILSTRAVYDGVADRENGLDETVQIQPTTLYGAHKAALEAFASTWGFCALRPTGVYGVIEPFERTKWVDLARQTLAGKDLQGNRVATEVHGADVAQAARLLLTAEGVAGETYNCSDIVVSTSRLIRHFRGLAEDPSPEPRPTRIMRTEKLRALGWRPGGEALLQKTLAVLVQRLR